MTMERTRSWVPVAVAVVMLLSGLYISTASANSAAPSHAGVLPISAGRSDPASVGPASGLVQYSLNVSPQRVAYDPTNGMAFVSGYGRLEVLNTNNGTVRTSITTAGAAPQHSADYPVVYDPSDGVVYEGLYANSTIEYVYPGNLTHGRIAIDGGGYAMQLLYDPASGSVLILGPAGHGFWTLQGLTATNHSAEFGAPSNSTLGDLYGVYNGAYGVFYIASANATASGHPVWVLNSTTLSQVSYTVVPLTWQWGNFVEGNGTEVGVSNEGYFSVVNLATGKIANWTWTGSSVGSPYYSLAYSPQSNVFALASKHDYVWLFPAANPGHALSPAVGGPVPQVEYIGGRVNEFAATTWSPTFGANPAAALFLIAPNNGSVQSITTDVDTFSLTTVGNTVWIGGSQYGPYPNADVIESYTPPSLPVSRMQFGQSGGNASGANLSWQNPIGTVNVTLLTGTVSYSSLGLLNCNVTSRKSIGNVSSMFLQGVGFACAAVEAWGSTGPIEQSPFIITTPLLPDMMYYRLPAWNNLSDYAANDASGTVPDRAAPSHYVQQPVISWTSDGVYYVNATDQLVYYSFVSHSVTHHWPWVPLNQEIMTYEGIENTEWITPNGEWVYTFGGSLYGNLTFYGVNISSGKTVEHNFTGYSLGGKESPNIQINIIGLDGEYNTVAMLWVPNDSFVLYSLTNGSQWDSGPILTGTPEANNIYWVPELNSFVEIYADGANPSGWDQLLWNGSSFDSVSSGSIPSLANGVQGLYFNLTSHRLYSDVQAGPQTQYTWYWQINGTDLGPIHYVSDSVEITAPTHRMMESASGDGIGGVNYYGVPGGTSHWATAFLPNGSVVPAAPYAMGGSWNWSPQALEGLGYDASYQLYPLLSDCYQHACAIAGGNASWIGSGNVALVGTPSFPANAPLVLGPPAPPLLTVKLTAHTANLSWSEPASSEALNYTVWWGVAGKPFTDSVSLLPSNNSYTIGGLNSSTHYEFEVLAHNLDWYGNASIQGHTTNFYPVVIKESGLPVGTGWSITWNGTNFTSQNETLALSATNGSYSWDIPAEGSLTPSPSAGITNVSGTGVSITVTFSSWSPPATPNSISSSVVGSTYAILQWGAVAGARNYSISEGGTCSSLGASQSLGNVLQDNLSGLTPGTGYCIEIRAWNGTAVFNLTDDTQIFTGAPVVASVNAKSIDVAVSWQNPTGEPAVVVDAVYLYAADGFYLGSSGTGGPATSIILAGLRYSTTYSVRIKAEYSGGGSSMLSAPVSFTTPGCTQGCAASAQPGLLGWLSVPINAAILVGFAASAVLGAAAATFLRGPKKRRR